MEINEKSFLLKSDNGSKNSSALKNVSGTYQMFEFQGQDSARELVLIPVEVKVTHRSDFIGVELLDENSGEVTQLDYPMNGASYWNEKEKTFTFCRAVGNTYVADTIYIPDGDRNRRAILRATWITDERGRIHENFEEFDADGKRLASSPGYLRVLVPVKES